jgi:hypothetical protein
MQNHQSNYYHGRAEEVRAVARGTSDPLERNRLVEIADDYEKKASEARRIERLAKSTRGVVEMDEHGDKARHFRKRAGELRADALDTADEKARELLMERAQDCEEMAVGREAIAMTIRRRVDLTNRISGWERSREPL